MSTKTPIGRTCRGQRPQVLHGTWLEAEEFAYPAGGFTRRAYAELTRNTHNPIELFYGRKYTVRCSIPDTYFSIPARLKFRGKTIAGFLSIADADTETARYTFTPEADTKMYARPDAQPAPPTAP